MTEPLAIRTVICGLDQLDLHSASRITHVLSILDPGFPDPDAFKAYGPHARTSLRFHDEIDSHIRKWTQTQAPKDLESRLKKVGIPAERRPGVAKQAAAGFKYKISFDDGILGALDFYSK